MYTIEVRKVGRGGRVRFDPGGRRSPSGVRPSEPTNVFLGSNRLGSLTTPVLSRLSLTLPFSHSFANFRSSTVSPVFLTLEWSHGPATGVLCLLHPDPKGPSPDPIPPSSRVPVWYRYGECLDETQGKGQDPYSTCWLDPQSEVLYRPRNQEDSGRSKREKGVRRDGLWGT